MQQTVQAQQRLFSASEVAEFEYCPLVWWHEQFEPLAKAGSEELFSRLVELEHEHGPQAVALPEYEVIEQLLLRMGAFEEGREQHSEHAEEVEEAEVQARTVVRRGGRAVAILIVVLVVLAVLLIAGAFLIR
jgi:hypothetical protein